MSLPDPELNEADVFEAARQISDARQRQLFLDRACRGNAALRRRLEKLLDLQAEADARYEPAEQSACRAILNALSPAPDIGAEREKPGDLIGRYKLSRVLG